MAQNLPILCIDFDGVVHKYSKGWQDGSIYDGVTDGFLDWAIEAMAHFRLVIYSSRSKTPEGLHAMREWFIGLLASSSEPPHSVLHIDDFEFAHEKPPAFLTIDDRAIQFKGDWSELDPAKLREFKPWTMEGEQDTDDAAMAMMRLLYEAQPDPGGEFPKIPWEDHLKYSTPERLKEKKAEALRVLNMLKNSRSDLKTLGFLR